MLTWSNFEFVETKGELPWFPVSVYVGNGSSVEDALEHIERMYLNLLNALVNEAVNKNAHYVPSGTVVENVWSEACKKNSLPVHEFVCSGQQMSFRAAEDVVVKVLTASEEGLTQYKTGFWYEVKGDMVEASLYALISSETDQNKLGKAV